MSSESSESSSRRTFLTRVTGVVVTSAVAGTTAAQAVDLAHRAYPGARRIIHVVVGNEDWEPTQEEMRKICDLFQSATQDPAGATVVTRPGVEAHVLDLG